MYGFFIGDIIGNSYTHENEKYNLKTKEFELFTERSKFSDDTILTFATMDWLLNTTHTSKEMIEMIKIYYQQYPDKIPTIYGQSFANWVENGCTEFRKTTSNGGAMRCTPIAWYAKTLQEIDELIEKGITPTHNTKKAKKGAKIVCYTIFYLKNGKTKNELQKIIETKFKINLKEDMNEYKKFYTYTSDAIETVRPALISFLNSTSYEDAIRNAVSFGGDTDTITTLCSAISEAYYVTIPNEIFEKAKSFLPQKFITLLQKFNEVIKK